MAYVHTHVRTYVYYNFCILSSRAASTIPIHFLSWCWIYTNDHQCSKWQLPNLLNICYASRTFWFRNFSKCENEASLSGSEPTVSDSRITIERLRGSCRPGLHWLQNSAGSLYNSASLQGYHGLANTWIKNTRENYHIFIIKFKTENENLPSIKRTQIKSLKCVHGRCSDALQFGREWSSLCVAMPEVVPPKVPCASALWASSNQECIE